MDFFRKRGVRIYERRSDVLMNNDKMEIEGLLTSFVTEEFFTNARHLYNFFNTIQTEFHDALSAYKYKNNFADTSIIFVFKGGNVLRIVERDVLRELPGIVSSLLFDEYFIDFSRSDADFSIYVDPYIVQYNDNLLRNVHDEILQLSFEVQERLRRKFILDAYKYFSFCELNRNMREQKILNLIRKINESKSMKIDKENKLFYDTRVIGIGLMGEVYEIEEEKDPNTFLMNGTIRDKFIIRGKNDDIVRYFSGSSKNAIYLSYNDSLKFWAPSNRVQKNFYLSRTKVGFSLLIVQNKNSNVHRVQNIGGELIDVSIVREKSELVSFFGNLSSNLRVYKMKSYIENRDEPREIHFLSYTISFLRHDLYRMLFIETIYPWDDTKYKKRLNRIMFLYFIDLLLQTHSFDYTIDTVLSIEKFLGWIKMYLIFLKQFPASGDVMRVYQTLNAIWGTTTMMCELMMSLTEIYMNIVSSRNKIQRNVDDLIRFIEIIDDNINVSFQAVNRLKQYMWGRPLIYDNLYIGDFSDVFF